MFILIRDTHHRHAISLRPGVVVYVRVVVVCEGYPYSDQHPARRRLSLLSPPLSLAATRVAISFASRSKIPALYTISSIGDHAALL